MKKERQKLISLILILTLAISLIFTACGSSESKSDESDDSSDTVYSTVSDSEIDEITPEDEDESIEPEDSCEDVEVEEVSGTPSDIVSKFTGSWYDLYSSRCGMEITYDQSSDTFYINMSWSCAYNEIARWSLKGKYDSSVNGITYTGEHYNEIYDDNGNSTKNYNYTNGSGKFYFKSDGYMYWQDNNESAGADCYFERQ